MNDIRSELPFMRLKIPIVFLVIFCFGRLVNAQHVPPAADNYTPTHAVLVNPAAIADNHTFMEIRLAGLSALAQNNYFFIPNADPTIDPQDDFQAWKKYAVYGEGDIYGPAFTKVQKYFSFGVNLRVRNHLMAHQLPSNLSKFIKEGFSYNPQHGIDYDEGRFFFKQMSWGELGLNYAQMVVRNGGMIVTAGGSLKLLSGITNIGLTSKGLRYEVDSANIYMKDYTGKLNLTLPGFNRGMGIGMDAGIIFKRMLTDDNSFHIPHSVKRKCAIKEYKWKLGVSLLDLGYINFKRETSQYQFNNDSLAIENYENQNFDGITKTNEIVQESIERSGANPEFKDRSFATLPLSLSAQFDYNFENNIYASATLMMGIRQYNFMGGERMSSLTLMPRYETKWITFGTPLSLYRIRPPAFGFYLRAGYLSLGVNSIMPLLLRNDVYGVDAYFSLQIPFYSSAPCKEYLKKKSNYCPKPKLRILPSFKDIFGKKKKYK